MPGGKLTFTNALEDLSDAGEDGEELEVSQDQ